MALVLFVGLEETLYPRTYDSPSCEGISLDADAKTPHTATSSPIAMKTYRQTHPFHSWGVNPHESWRDLFLRPFQLALFPPVLWAGVFTGVSICWWAAIFTTESGMSLFLLFLSSSLYIHIEAMTLIPKDRILHLLPLQLVRPASRPYKRLCPNRQPHRHSLRRQPQRLVRRSRCPTQPRHSRARTPSVAAARHCHFDLCRSRLVRGGR